MAHGVPMVPPMVRAGVSGLTEGSLEHADANRSQEEAAREKLGRGEVRREKIRDRESQKREDAGARKGTEVAKHRVFQCFVAPESRKVLAKATVAETSD